MNLVAAVPWQTEIDWRRCLFESGEEAQLVCDRLGRVLDANIRARRLLGRDNEPTDLAGCLFEALPEATLGRLFKSPETQVGRGESLQAVALKGPGRSVFLADLQVTPLAGAYILVTIRDASRRWRMESHVHRLVTAVDATPDVFFLTDAERRITFVNAAFQNVTGYDIEDVLGRQADFLRAPGQELKMKSYLDTAMAGSDWTGELSNRRSDGSTYAVEATISPIFDRDRSFLGFVASERDITKRKQLESELQREHDFVRSILNSIETAIYTVDQEFRLTHTNDGWKRFPSEHGWLTVKAPPRIGQPLLELVAKESSRQDLLAVFRSVLADGAPEELQNTSDDGHHWLIRISPWYHREAVSGLIYEVSDQTNLHQLQRQLYQSQKMETIGALAAGVAHDFNNLLLVIRGNASLLGMQDGLDAQVLSKLDQIDQAATRAGEITHQLLSFSRASDEKITVFDFNELIKEVSQLTRRSIKAKVHLELRPAPVPVKVSMDATRASQLLLNLCVNAQDAMPNGGKLTIINALVRLTSDQAVRAHTAPGSLFVHCQVADTGTGIPPEVLPRIFDPFYTTKGTGKGTGLGLSIAHSVVTQAMGFLEVETALGKGTVFHIYLPSVDTSVTAAQPTVRRELGTGRGTVLVVDDLDLVRDFANAFLNAAGFQVLMASDALGALEILDRNSTPIDLLFTDQNMPGLTGTELIRRAAARWPAMKFILTSGCLDAEERQQVDRLPCVRILDKPYDTREAVDAIVEMLRPAQGSSPPVPPQ